MKVTYIAASIIPSQTANSINVMKMCSAMARIGNEVTLIASKGETNKVDCFNYYGVNEDFKLVLSNRFFLNRLIKGMQFSKDADIVYTRWLLAAIVLILFTNKKIAFEYHSPFTGKNEKIFGRILLHSKKVVKHIFITKALYNDFNKNNNFFSDKGVLILPDGADEIVTEKELDIHDIDCIYIGSFQKGKGVETVVNIANELPHLRFAIVGGRKEQILEKKEKTKFSNIEWFGHLPHKDTHLVLNRAKIALLPNSPKVLINNNSLDIGKWTSPMKLFEYMASEKSIIASDLSVLKEILVNEENSLLVCHDSIVEWKTAINRVLNDQDFASKISKNAYLDFINNYTWTERAKKFFSSL